MGKTSGNFKLRLFFVSFIFLILGGLLVGRLFFIQVAGGDKVGRQYSFYKTISPISIRGDIYFKEKDGNLVSAAVIKDGFIASVNPNVLSDPEFVCEKIGEIVTSEFDKEDCLIRSSKKNDPSEIVARRLNLDQAEKIRNLEIEGLAVLSEQWRFYPGGSLASQILGFVGYKNDELTGRYGIERYYEKVLKGEEDRLKDGNSFAMLFFNLGKEFLGDGEPDGHDVILTIEPRVQVLLDNELQELIEEWGAEGAGGIIINPKTGAILAMSGKPDFDPNHYGEVEDYDCFRNQQISSIFEMGSVTKPLTMAIGIDTESITSKTTYYDKGNLVLDGRKIENYDGKARGLVDMQVVLNESLNTGAVFVMQKTGKENFQKYLEDLGLAKKTEIDLPDEASGNLTNLSSMRDIEFATASYGHGIAMTPIEFTVAVSSLANGGFVPRPYVVEKIEVKGGKDYEAQQVMRGPVFKEETTKEISRMLINVVDEALLNGTVKLDHYSIAAKTGTALLPKEGELGYYENEYFHSFFGYGPAFDAEFLIFLYLKKPQEVRYASQTLTEPFMKLMKFLLDYYEIPPDR
ncbi:MAG: penicillin-binding protein 2 [Patescibacteria group bacterium]